MIHTIDENPLRHASMSPGPAVQWETVACNLCGRDDTEVYHRERLAYFGQPLDFTIVRCRCCGLVYTNPRLTEHNATYLYEPPVDDPHIESHAAAKQSVFVQALQTIRRCQSPTPPIPRAKLLDIGCGSGHFLSLARNHDFDVCGLEPATPYADYARRKFHLDVLNADILAADYPEQSFDVITAWDVIEHVNDPLAVLRQCSRWLTPAGIMALRFPSAAWQKIKGVVLHNLLASRRPAFAPTIHLYFFSPETFTQMARKAGLEVICIRTTPLEANRGHPLGNFLKKGVGVFQQALAGFTGRHWGNLEIYCRKTPS